MQAEGLAGEAKTPRGSEASSPHSRPAQQTARTLPQAPERTWRCGWAQAPGPAPSCLCGPSREGPAPWTPKHVSEQQNQRAAPSRASRSQTNRDKWPSPRTRPVFRARGTVRTPEGRQVSEQGPVGRPAVALPPGQRSSCSEVWDDRCSLTVWFSCRQHFLGGGTQGWPHQTGPDAACRPGAGGLSAHSERRNPEGHCLWGACSNSDAPAALTSGRGQHAPPSASPRPRAGPRRHAEQCVLD